MKPIKHVRLVSPSAMYAIKTPEERAPAFEFAGKLPVTLSLGRLAGDRKNVAAWNGVDPSGTPEERMLELREAFEDGSVDALWSTRGGALLGRNR